MNVLMPEREKTPGEKGFNEVKLIKLTKVGTETELVSATID
jgi:hypothetical protein